MPPNCFYPNIFTRVVPVKEVSPLSAETAGKARSGRLSSTAGRNSAVVDGVRLDSDSSTDGGGNVSGARGAGSSRGSRVARAVVVAAALRAGARAARARVGSRVGAGAAGARVVGGLVSDGGSRARVTRAGSNGDIDGRGGDSDSLLGDGDGDGGSARTLAVTVTVSRRSVVGGRSIATSVGTRAAGASLNRLDCNVGRVSSGGRGGGGGFRAVLTVAESAGEGDGLLGSSLDGGGDDRSIGSLANGVSQGLVGDNISDRNASVRRGSDGRRSSLDGRAGDEAGGVSGLQRGRDAGSLGHGADGGGQDNGICDNHGAPGGLGEAASTGGVEASRAVGDGGSTADDGVNRGSNDGQRSGSSIVNGSGGGVGPGEVQVADGRAGRGQAGEKAKSSNGSGLHLDDSCDGVFVF